MHALGKYPRNVPISHPSPGNRWSPAVASQLPGHQVVRSPISRQSVASGRQPVASGRQVASVASWRRFDSDRQTVAPPRAPPVGPSLPRRPYCTAVAPLQAGGHHEPALTRITPAVPSRRAYHTRAAQNSRMTLAATALTRALGSTLRPFAIFCFQPSISLEARATGYGEAGSHGQGKTGGDGTRATDTHPHTTHARPAERRAHTSAAPRRPAGETTERQTLRIRPRRTRLGAHALCALGFSQPET
eukprot:55727-Prymnesium_polylepis.1